MQSTLTLSDAKARFSEVVERVTGGEEFVITRMGRPVVRIVGYEPHGQAPRLGDLAGRIRIAEDFDEWPPDIAQALGMAESG